MSQAQFHNIRKLYGRIHLVRHGEDFNMHKTVWCEGGMQLEDIGTKNVREDELDTRLEYFL